MRLTEKELIERFFAAAGPQRRDVRLGIGDDAAIVAVGDDNEVAVSVDMLVSGQHFPEDMDPGDIGYRASISAYSREVLAATFNVHIDDLPNFPFTNTDPLIVTRNNPLDDHAMGER